VKTDERTSIRAEMERFAAFLTSAEPTAARRACWTEPGLAYMGLTPSEARERGMEGWQTWPDR
jgi:hypothetical protein